MFKVILFIILFPLHIFAMDTINQLAPELFKIILKKQKSSQYPWKNFSYISQLGQVCKQWYSFVSDHDTLTQILNIPPMHYAAMMDDAKKIIELKLAGHSPLAPDKHGFNPAHYAFACKGRNALIMLKIGWALAEVVQHNFRNIPHDEESGEFLLSLLKPTSKECTIEDFLSAIKRNDYTKTIAILSDSITSPSFTSSSFAPSPDHHYKLIEYAQTHNFNDLAQLLRYYAQCILESALFDNVRQKKDSDKFEGFFKTFVLYKANPNAQDISGATPLYYIVKRRMTQVLQQFLHIEDVDINTIEPSTGLTLIQVAVISDNNECLPLLMDKGTTTNLTTACQATLLHLAAYNNSTKCLTYLLPLSQNQINSGDEYGYSPLIRAVINKHMPCIELLLQAKADVHLKDYRNQTALHFAASKNLPEAIHLLVAHGADLNCTADPDIIVENVNYGLYTPLHFAAHRSNTQALNALLHHGADQTLKTQTGKTALELLVAQQMESLGDDSQ